MASATLRAQTMTRRFAPTQATRRVVASRRNTSVSDLYTWVLKSVLFPVLSLEPPSETPPPMPTAQTKIHGNTVLISEYAIREFKKSIALKQMAFETIGNNLSMCFAKAAKKLLLFNLPNDVTTLIVLMGGCVKPVIPPQLTPKEHDDLLFQVIELFMASLRGVIQQEGVKGVLTNAKVLQPEGHRIHLGSFTKDEGNLQSVDLEGSRLHRWVRAIFNKSKEEHDGAILQIKRTTSEKVSFAALKTIVEMIKKDNAPGYTPMAFESRAEYDRWKQTEISKYTGFLGVALKRNPRLLEVKIGDINALSEFIPPEPEAYYKVLLKQCFQHEVLLEKSTFELSKASKAILAECGLRWGLTDQFRKVALLDILVADYRAGKMELPDVWKIGMKELLGSIQRMGLPRHSDSRYYLLVLKSLHDTLINGIAHLFDNVLPLETADPSDPMSPGEKLKFVAFILTQIYSDERWSKVNTDLLPSVITSAIESSLTDRYNLISTKLAVVERELTRMQKLVLLINREIIKCDVHFPEPIIPSVDIKTIAAKWYVDKFKKVMESFSKDVEAKFRRREDEGYEIAEMLELYKLVRILYDRADQLDVGVDFDVENWFAPFVQRWLHNTDEKWMTWVESAVQIEKDQGYKPTLPPKYMYSSSVVDLFSSFHAGLDFFQNLKFRDDHQRKELLTKDFINMIKKALTRYSELMLEEFEEMQKMTDVKQFSISSCMKLNNIIGACDKVEEIFDQLSINRNGDIDEDAPRVDEEADLGHILFDIRIVNANDLQICDWNSSDPYVKMEFRGKFVGEPTEVKWKTLNPVWHHQCWLELKNNLENSECFIKFIVMDKDLIGTDDFCGESSQIYLRDRKYTDFLKHDEKLKLHPQGTLNVRVTRMGYVDDPDFYVKKAAEAVNTALEEMLHIYMERMMGFVKTMIEDLIKKATASKTVFNDFFSFAKLLSKSNSESQPQQDSSERITDTHIEEMLQPLLEYLNTNLGLFNEKLDPRLGDFIERTPSLLGQNIIAKKKPRRAMFFKKNVVEEKQEKQTSSSGEEIEEDKPNAIIKLLWQRIVILIYQEISMFGAGDNKATRKANRKELTKPGTGVAVEGKKWGVRMASLPSTQLNQEERDAVVVLDIVVEYLKSFFFCEVDGVCHGFSIEELEGEEYKKLRELILIFQQKPTV